MTAVHSFLRHIHVDKCAWKWSHAFWHFACCWKFPEFSKNCIHVHEARPRCTRGTRVSIPRDKKRHNSAIHNREREIRLRQTFTREQDDSIIFEVTLRIKDPKVELDLPVLRAASESPWPQTHSWGLWSAKNINSYHSRYL